MISSAASQAMWGQRIRTLAFWLLALLVAASIGVLAAKPAYADTFFVNSKEDENDLDFPGGTFDGSSDGNCDVTLSIAGPQCTLRAAIQTANANNNAPTVDLISFDIPGDGPHTIAPASEELPTIEEPVTIDGYTQGERTSPTTDDAKENTRASGMNADLRIELRGASANEGSNGLTSAGGGTTIRGLVITQLQRNTSTGIGGDAVNFTNTAGNTNNRVEGNYIGTNRTGTTAEPNEGRGVSVGSTSTGTIIGGATPDKRNLISANVLQGVILFSDATIVRGNLIGTNKDGTSTPNDLGNNLGGIDVLTGGNNLITENVIAFNGDDGVEISVASVGNRILTNSIFSNTGLGIDLSGGGREQDPKDPDTGANNKQNYPLITSATSSGTATTIQGRLNSTPGKTFTIQFFSNPVLTDEGRAFLGQVKVRTDERGRASFSFLGPALDTGQQITATATGAEGTSEFSNVKAVGTAS
jgi:CSLREA domain-containing protein